MSVRLIKAFLIEGKNINFQNSKIQFTIKPGSIPSIFRERDYGVKIENKGISTLNNIFRKYKGKY